MIDISAGSWLAGREPVSIAVDTMEYRSFGRLQGGEFQANVGSPGHHTRQNPLRSDVQRVAIGHA